MKALIIGGAGFVGKYLADFLKDSGVETYITKMLNGKVISTTLLSRDTYSAMERIVKRGTKKVDNPVQPPVNTNENQVEPPKKEESQNIVETNEGTENPENTTDPNIEGE